MSELETAADAQPAGTPSSSFRRATVGMAAGTVLSRLTGFGRVFALAYAVGYNHLSDSYNLANTTPNIVYDLLLGGVLSATLIPVFVEQLADRDDERAWESISAVATAAIVALAVVSGLFFLAAPWVVRLYAFRVHGSSRGDELAVATSLVRMFAPQVFFYGAITVASAVLNARRRFLAVAVTPVINNLVVIAVLLALPHFLHSTSVHDIRRNTGALLFLGLGTTAGVALQAIGLGPSMRASRLRLRPRWAPHDPAVRKVLTLSGWTFGYVVANQITITVLYVLALARTTALTAFQSAYQFFQVPYAVLAVSVMTALLPDLSARWSSGDRAAFRRRLAFGLRLTALLMLPAAAAYVALARPVIDLLLHHGRLSASGARLTADTLAVFALGLPTFSAYLLLMRAYQAMQDTKTMFLVYVAENVLTIVVAVALFPWLGVQGLAWSWTVGYAGGTALAVWDLRRRIGGIEGRAVLMSTVRIGVATAVMTLGVVAASHVVGGTGTVRAALRVGAATVAGVTLFLLAARLVGVTELSDFLRSRRSTA